MSNELTTVLNTALSPAMQKYLAERGGGLQSELGAGVTAGFAVVGYRGKVWNIKHRGEERVQLRPDDGTPKASMEFVIIKAAPNISKIYYIDGWQEGNSAPPDCWSVDGIRPDPASPKKQCTNCAGCPMNQWGSAITPAGKKAKKCTDSKRLAVVPADNIGNEQFGGPMLLRVPAASLADMASYDGNLLAKGFPYFSVATAISFDISESYPKFVFTARRPLSEDEAVKVLEMREGEQVARILSAPVEEVTADVASPGGEANGSDSNSGNGQSLSQRAAAPDPALAEAARQAAVKAAQEAAQKAAADAAKASQPIETAAAESVEERIRREVEARIKAEEAERARKEAEARAAAEAAKAEAARKAEAEKGAVSEEDRIRAEIEAKVRAEMAAKSATAGAGAASEGAAATLVAENVNTPSTASAEAGNVVDAEYKETQDGAAAPKAFDSLLDDLLSS